MKNLVYIFITLLIFLPTSCDKEREHPVPFVRVDFNIIIGTTQYIELNTIGGYAYFTGGFKGIIVYRVSETDFKAYDRACPYHPFNDKAIVRVDQDWLATCSECGSIFELNFGSVVDGPSKHPLREYRTFYTPPYLQVTSY
jgi:nitrite reductase/ring-hydroxylating ferredoxin subunit